MSFVMMWGDQNLRRAWAGLALLVFLAGGLALDVTSAQAATEDEILRRQTPVEGNVPGGSLGNDSNSEIWRAIRHGEVGKVSGPNADSGLMIQSEGEDWRSFRNGPLPEFGAWILGGIVVLLALFFFLRGRIRIDGGPSDRTIERFNTIERIVHWTTAVSFIILAITGLNLIYGRTLLLPILGPDIFATLTILGKYAHNYVAFAFMLGVIMMFLFWVRHNLPSRYDLVWIAEGGGLFKKGGGLFKKGVHPPSKKFNAGQKVIFWAVILGGFSISLSGISLMFPFEIAMFEPTFRVLNVMGFNLPAELTPMQEMHYSQMWHSLVALVLIAIVLAHVYIGSLGMEGAFSAMGSGQVDENWAREHHSLWVADVKGEPVPGPDDSSGQQQAAE